MESPNNDDNANTGERDSEKNNDEGIDDFIPLETFDSLKTGLIFENETIMKNSIKHWQDKFFMPFVVSKSETGRFSLKCPHGVERASRGTGKHKVQSINFTGCSALLNVRQQKDGTWKVTKCILNRVLSRRFHMGGGIFPPHRGESHGGGNISRWGGNCAYAFRDIF